MDNEAEIRHLLNRAHRLQLRRAGLAFCDDDCKKQDSPQEEVQTSQQLDQLLAEAVGASSVDDESQGPGAGHCFSSCNLTVRQEHCWTCLQAFRDL